MRAEVVTFGEIMLRLCPEGYERIVQAQSFGATYAGSEASVAVGKLDSSLPVEELIKRALKVLARPL